jgi:transposase-like protein
MKRIHILKEALKSGNILQTAHRFNVSSSVVRRWRKHYSKDPEISRLSQEFENNKKYAKDKYPDDKKRLIVQEARDLGSKDKIAKKYDIHPTTIVI